MRNNNLYAYINFFKDKKEYNCNLTNAFIKNYQQEISGSGYGYINLANFIEKRGETDGKLKEEFIAYYEYLNSDNVNELENLIGMRKEEMLDVKVNAIEGEPNQKWHLLVSYLGMTWFQRGRLCIHSVSCPELWIWMFETSGIFKQCQLDKIYNKAIEYREKKIGTLEWKKYIKEYRRTLHKEVVYTYFHKIQS